MINLQTREFTLLIVDDEKQNRLLLTELFRDEYKIILAKHGEQAIKLANEHLPDLILLDVLMPGMDGQATIRELKRSDATRHIPVIFITGLNSPDDEEQGLNLGAADYIGKPFHAAVVRARVRNQLQIVHQRELLEQLALLDGLTGISNRRKFDVTFEQEWVRCSRSQQPISLLMADVDHFKNYNDTLGHAAGDRVLQQIASLLRDSIKRPSDLVARYGGEEFVLLLPETELHDAQIVTRRIFKQLEEINIPHPKSPTADHITLSLGGISFIPAPSTPPDLSQLERADTALYQAKEQGRNRWLWADQPVVNDLSDGFVNSSSDD